MIISKAQFDFLVNISSLTYDDCQVTTHNRIVQLNVFHIEGIIQYVISITNIDDDGIVTNESFEQLPFHDINNAFARYALNASIRFINTTKD